MVNSLFVNIFLCCCIVDRKLVVLCIVWKVLKLFLRKFCSVLRLVICVGLCISCSVWCSSGLCVRWLSVLLMVIVRLICCWCEVGLL